MLYRYVYTSFKHSLLKTVSVLLIPVYTVLPEVEIGPNNIIYLKGIHFRLFVFLYVCETLGICFCRQVSSRIL